MARYYHVRQGSEPEQRVRADSDLFLEDQRILGLQLGDEQVAWFHWSQRESFSWWIEEAEQTEENGDKLRF